MARKKEVTACSIVAKALREKGQDISEDEVERIYWEQMRLRKTDPFMRMMQDMIRKQILKDETTPPL